MGLKGLKGDRGFVGPKGNMGLGKYGPKGDPVGILIQIWQPMVIQLT